MTTDDGISFVTFPGMNAWASQKMLAARLHWWTRFHVYAYLEEQITTLSKRRLVKLQQISLFHWSRVERAGPLLGGIGRQLFQRVVLDADVREPPGQAAVGGQLAEEVRQSVRPS